MIDDAVLAALASAIDHDGDVDRAHAAIGRVDPFLRRRAQRRLRTACADAALATHVRRDPEGARHTLRIAYLLVARALPPRGAHDDVAAVEAAYEAARVDRAPSVRFWWPTTLIAIAAAASLGGGVAAWRASRPTSPFATSTAAAMSIRPPRGAFATGGVPSPSPADATLARVFGVDLPDFLVALDRRADADANEATARLAAPEVRAALGEGAARALDEVVAAAKRASAGGSAGAEPDADALGVATAALDDELAAEGLGYFVDGDVITDDDADRRLVLVHAFRVERVDLFGAGAATIRAVHLRRLDKLNWTSTLLGFTRPSLRAAAVLLDQLDEQVLSLIAPALAPRGSVPLFDPAPAARGDAAGSRAAIEARAGEIVRAEYGALPGIDARAAAKLGELLLRRREIFADWERLAAARGMTLVVPATLRLPERFAASLEGAVPAEQMRELVAIDAALGAEAMRRAFEAMREALAASVERHEVQHRLDALGKQPPVMPSVLEARVGPLARAGNERRHATTARAELSAYLAELARDARTPRVGLALVARFLFDGRMHGAPESYAALAILEGLADALGVRPAAPLLANGAIDRRAVGDAWIALVALPPERLREAARALWERLFEAPLPSIERITMGLQAAPNPAPAWPAQIAPPDTAAREGASR